MAGYIGSKAVLLSTTAATVTGAADIGGDLTVDTDTLHVDSTNNRVGIGTSSPTEKLSVAGTVTAESLTLGTDSGDAFNAASLLRIQGAPDVYGSIKSATTGIAGWTMGDTDDDVTAGIFYNNASDYLYLLSNNAERLRIDSSGNLLVGTTDLNLYNNNTGETGFTYKNGAGVAVSRLDNALLFLNRQNSDGDIVQFRKDGTTVGSIGAQGGNLSVKGGGDVFIVNAGGEGFRTGGLSASAGAIVPVANNSDSDNTNDIGVASVRWDDIYATNGTIQTSDRNEKQDIAELDEAEKRVAVAAKGLIRKYRWKDAVAEKGDDARIHVGIIAQDLQAAFAAEGLDAGRYAMFISSTWWEHEGQTYETAEEAPEGATERTRLGVRYPELLAFIIGAM